MAKYVKQTWVNRDPTKPASAARLGHIEDGVLDSSEIIYEGRLSEANLASTIDSVVAGSAVAIQPQLYVAGAGSSTMFSGQGGAEQVLSRIATRAGLGGFFRGAKGGLRAQHILAWLNIEPVMLTVAGGSIPASGSVNVTTSFNAWHANAGFTGTLAGVPGTLEAYTTNQWRFTRTTSGAAVAVTGPAAMLSTDWPAHQADIAMINIAKNDLTMMVGSDESVVAYAVEKTRKVYDWFGRGVGRPKRLVWGHFVDAQGTNDAYKRRVLMYNAALSREYGAEFIDVQGLVQSTRVWSLAGISATTEDTTAQQVGTLPPSLQYDTIHLNNAGINALAWYVVERMRQLGYVSTPAVDDIPAGGVGPIPAALIDLDPGAVVAAEAGAITRWPSKGSLPLILDSKDDASGSFNWPTLQSKAGPDGGPVARFASASSQKIGCALYPYPQAQPITYVLVVKINSAAGDDARILSGLASGFHGIRMSARAIGYASTTFVSSGVVASTGWQIVVASFNGASSAIRVDGVEVTTTPGTASAENLSLGGTWGAAYNSTQFFDGDIRSLRAYPFAATEHERIVLARRAVDEFNAAPLAPEIPIAVGDVFTSDSFTGSDLTTLSGRNTDIAAGGNSRGYATSGGSLRMLSGKLAAPSSAITASAYLPVSYVDHSIELKVDTLPSGGSAFLVLAVRALSTASDNTNTSYRATIDQAGSVNIQRRSGGSNTTLQTAATTIAAGDTLQLRAVGSTISLWKNGSSVWSTTDATITSGGYAGVASASDTTWRADDLKIVRRS